MIVYRTKEELIRHLDDLRKKQKSIGFVPTMGALHDGHISLVSRSKKDNDATIVSIFVNPTQFNDLSDLENYPRTPEEDLIRLNEKGVDLVFIPSVQEMYPENDSMAFDLEGLDLIMEGASRKGHFNGVAQIVSKFFQMINPERAYFGQKDFQQLVIIRHLVRKMDMKIEIVSCPIIREKDGLAMSSRNIRLGRKERKAAPFIFETLSEAVNLKGEMSPQELKMWVTRRFEQQSLMTLVYFEIVEDKALKPVSSWEGDLNKVGCIAVILGGVRLIDNMNFD